ncbi:hypothetical protein F4860DRAFT_461874 [Xylaria cubensis]|nr:hypothetical protein F4860DRAFT_461874 [Xylaria cubensis]
MSFDPMSIDSILNPDFHEFNKLPPELRDMVWDNALIAEATNRMVFADLKTGAIYPTRHLVSKISQVCYASNKRAKHIYNYREPVYEVRMRDTLPSVAGPFTSAQFNQFELGEEVGVVYLSPRYETFCIGLIWPPVGICPTHDCMRRVSYYSTRAFDIRDPYILSVWRACFFEGYQVCRQGHFRGEGTPGYSTLTPMTDPDAYMDMFPRVPFWFGIFYPALIDIALPTEIADLVLTTDVQVIADEGWKGLLRLMNEAPYKYAVAAIGGNPTILTFMPLRFLGHFINIYEWV